MIAKTVLLVLIAFSFFSCDNPSKPMMELQVYHALSNDSYNSDGHILIHDARIKAIYDYEIEFNVIHNNKGIGNLFIAAKDWPHDKEYLDYMPGNYSVDISVVVFDGVIRIIDPDKTLLDLIQNMVDNRIRDESDEMSDNTFAYLTVHFDNY